MQMRTTPQQTWGDVPCMQFVTLTFWKGYVAGTKQFYPCPSLRLINAETEETVEEVHGNGKVEM